MKKNFLPLLALLLWASFHSFATVYYNKASGGGAFSTTANWGTATNGTGSSPANFTTSGDVFNISNGTTYTVAGNWTLGAGVAANIGTGVSVTIPSGTNRILGAGALNLQGTATLTVANATEPNLGTCSAASTVIYAGNADAIQVTTYGNLAIAANTINFGAGTTTVAGNYTQTAGLVTLNSTNAAYTLNVTGNFTLSGTGCFIVESSAGGASIGTVNVGGSLSVTSNGADGDGSPTGDAAAILLTGVTGGNPIGIFQVNGNATFNSSSGHYVNFGKGTGVGMAASYFGVKGNLSVSGGGTFFTSGTTAAKGIFFNGVGTAAAPQQFTYSSSANSDYVSYVVNTSTYVSMQSGLVLSALSGPFSTFNVDGALDCQAFTISGGVSSGGVQINSGATLVSANTTASGAINNSITATGSTFSADANYVFNGAAAQATGNKMPASIVSPGSVTINNASGVTLSQSTSIGTGCALNFTMGKLALASTTLTLNGTVTGMSAANSITGGASSNLTIGATGALGTLFFDQGTPGTSNNIATLTMNGAGGSATLGNSVNAGTTLNLYGGTLNNSTFLTVANGATINRDNGVLSAVPTWGSGGAGIVNVAYTAGGPGSAAVTTGNELPLTATNLGNLSISKTGATITLGSAITVNGAVALTAGTLDASPSGFDISLHGNWLNNSASGAFIPRGATVSLVGTTTQSLGGAFNSVFNNVTLNNSAGAILGRDENINGTLTLSSGTLSIGANNLVFGPSAPAIAGTFSNANMVIANGAGQVRKQFSADGSFLYPIGDNVGPNYTPITLSVTAGSYAGGAYVAAKVVKAKHPNNANTNNYLNRYWPVVTSGLTGPSYSVTAATYMPGDVVGTEANIAMGEYPGALPWVKFGPAVTATHTLSSGAVTSASGDFSGINTAGPSISSSADVAICGSGSATLTATLISGDPTITYSWSPSAGLSATTGISVTASPESATVYTVTATDGNGLTGTATTTVSVNPMPSLTSASNNGPVCAGTTLSLSANGAANVTGYSWYGPVAITDAATANASVASAATTASGVYTVAVSNGTGPGCTATYTTSATINASPTISGITASSNNLCVGTLLTLNAGMPSGSGSLVSYNWAGPNGFSTTTAANSTSFTPTSTAASGNYSLSVTYTGCTGSMVETPSAVTVNALPTIGNITPSATSICVGNMLTLTANSVTGAGTANSYNWSGPNGFSTTTSIDNVIFTPAATAASGDYSVTVTYTGNGCTSAAAVTSPSVTVNALPAIASITPSATNICAGTLLTLNAAGNSGTGTLTSYNWSGPDGFSSTTASNSVSLTPASAAAGGNYSVTVTYPGAGCTSMAAATSPSVTVNAAPTVASIIPSSGNLCIGTPLTLTAGSTTGTVTSYNWAGPNGFTTTTSVNNVVFTPASVAASGDYSLSVTYSGTGCTSATAVTAVTVNALPTVTSITPSTTNICTGSLLTLNAGAVTGAGTLSSYNWAGPNGYSTTTMVNSAAFTPNTIAASGNYSVTVTYTGTGCTSVAAVTSPSVTVSALPAVASITPSSNNLCVGAPLTLNAATGSGTGTLTSYNWSGPNGFTVTTATNSTSFTPVTTASGGDYSVTVTYTGTGCTSAAAVTSPSVTVNALPTVASVTASSNTLCAGTALTFTAGTPAGVGALSSYNWAGPNGYNTTTATNSATFTPTSVASSGNYSLTVTYTGTGCTSAAVVTSPSITVNALPAISAITPSSTNICIGNLLAFTAGTPSGTGMLTAYNWSGPNGFSTTTAGGTTSFTPSSTAASGDYSLTVTYDGTGCTSNAAITSVTVNELPTIAGITPSATTICTGTALTLTAGAATGAGTASSYAWSGPNSYTATTTINNAVFTPTNTASGGIYSLVVTYPGTGCVSGIGVSPAVTVNDKPTVAGIVSTPTLLCAGFDITLTGSAAAGTGALTSYNWSGPNGYSSTTTTATQTYNVPDALASGMYSLTVTYPGTGCTSGPVASAAVTVNPMPIPYTVTGGGTYCAGGTGVNVGVSNSEVGVNYQLYYGSSTLGTAVAGTGMAIDFGQVTGAGSYSVRATNNSTSCEDAMAGSAVVSISIMPLTYTVTGGGNYCAGTGGVHVGLTSSDNGVGYQVYNGATPVGSLYTGTGTTLDFGLFTADGTYTVVANPGSGCANPMGGSATVLTYPLPAAYTVTGGGAFCSGGAGVHIGLDWSVSGVNYQLYNGAMAIGTPVGGTSSALDFGFVTDAGIYTVTAVNATTMCSSNMAGSATVSINPTPAQYNVTGGGTACENSGAISVGLDNSETGINYQLYNGALAVGSPVSGTTGSSIIFGAQNTSGTYSALATNNITSCSAVMAGNAVVNINPAPAAIAVTGGGSYCAGGTGQPIGLANSAAGINYQLYNGATAAGSIVAGNGSAISFGSQTMAGTYTVLATNTVTACPGAMSGNAVVTINTLPTAYTVTGGGSFCSGGAGQPVGLGLSETGVNYKLYNGAAIVGAAVAGTGAAISFGMQTAAGTYTVLAANTSTTCVNSMAGNAIIISNPLPTAYNVTGGGNYCAGGAGIAIGLDNSNSGISYQLYMGSSPVGSPVAGTDGAAISFGLQVTAGNYSVAAVNTLTACPQAMAGNVNVGINSLPAVFVVTGGGSYCSAGTGVVVGINGSEAGIHYQLYNGMSTSGSAITGSGVAFDFPAQTAAGIYSVLATNPATTCASNMPGNTAVVINPLPMAYNVTGGGAYCSGGVGTHIGVDFSTSGVNYQLYNGSTAIGSAVAGTGAAIDLGLVTPAGTYTVRATNNLTSCSGPMAGSAIVSINPVPSVYNVTGGGTFCENGAGMPVGLDNSDNGINYQLYDGALAIGSPIAGTAATAISFGSQTMAGTYSVLATNAITSCTSPMASSATIIVNPAPMAFTVTGGGNTCAGSGVAIGLSNSVSGINYQLYRGATAVGGQIAGTGSPISFGLQSVAGTYTVQGVNNTTACANAMAGNAVIVVNPLPLAYNMVGGGSFCVGSTGVAVGLSNSQTGINYQLYNGAAAVGGTIAGTGSAVSFGIQTASGTYTAFAINTATSCTKAMSGTSVVVANPLPMAYAVSGGGNYCAGSEGAHVGMAMTAPGVNYQLYTGGGAITLQPGSGAAVDFGPQYTAGTYTVLAIDAFSGCSANMSGSASVNISSTPAAFAVTGGGTTCSNGSGVTVGLGNSTAGINYLLYRGATQIGSAVAGSGSAISFGLQTVAGTYSVSAINLSTGCTAAMSGSANVNVVGAPNVYTVTGGGSYCPGGSGVNIGLTGSDMNVLYQPYLGAAPTGGGAVTGTGATLNLGLASSAGAYTVLATSIVTGCSMAMSGSASISLYTLPNAYNVTGGGSYCSGTGAPSIGLSNSQSAVTYKLYNGAAIASILSGTGSGLNFGSQASAGTYTILATDNITGCNSNMLGSAVITINPLPLVYSVTGGGSYCAGGAGFSVTLNGSNTGINYQLYNGSAPVGSLVGGTNSSINFGTFTAAGAYSVRATNAVTGCVRNMAGTAAIIVNPLPNIYTVNGGGNYCAGGTGVAVGISGSDAGIAYRLYKGGVLSAGPITSLGGTFSFGLQTGIGTYTVSATNPVTGCAANMASSVTVGTNPLPAVNSVTGGGAYCAGGVGAHVGLDWSVAGISYQLYSGSLAMGSPVMGANAPLDFGTQTVVGTYSVQAINPATSCVANMAGSKIISINALPAVYNVNGGGSYCAAGAGVSITLSGSDAGINYQLYNGSATVGTPLAGVGDALNFGLQAAVGTYSVAATNAVTGCVNNMSGTAAVSAIPLPTAFTVLGGGSYCAGATGVNISLSGSAAGISYRLFKGGVPFGAPVIGTGSGISLGTQTVAGTYAVQAVNPATSCSRFMSGTVTVNVNPTPFVYSLTGGGSYCTGGAGAVVGLGGSVPGSNYSLYRDGVATGITVGGNGSPIDFGLQTVPGIYTAIANNGATGCSANMNGGSIVSISAPPFAYNVNGGGSYCAGGTGVSIILNGSAPGVNYQLYRGATAVGGIVGGTGSPINFGLQLMAGHYTVMAADAVTTCFSIMSGSADVIVTSPPAPFTVTGGGAFCIGDAGVPVGLNGSENGVNYFLYNGPTLPVATAVGSGSSINFGMQAASGTYTVYATNPLSTCSNSMSGSVVVTANPRPLVFDIGGGGNYRAGGAGTHISLTGSQTGVSYQLYNDGVATHAPVAGTGLDIDFGLTTTIGTYSIAAVSNAGCASDMAGSTTVNVNALPAVFNITGGGSYCAGGTGVVIAIDGSEAGVNYKLYRLGSLVGGPMAGTGSAINFGQQTLTGTYTIVVENSATGCTRNIPGVATVSVNTPPTAFSVSSGGSYCTGNTGVNILLGGSETGVNYQLYNGASAIGAAMAGTGLGIDFGAQLAGVYTVRATNTSTNCTANMAGVSTVTASPLPTAYNVTGGGGYCVGGSGVHIGLSGSETGVSYQLYSGAFPIGGAVAGTGAGIDFGLKTAAGTYSVIASGSLTSCTRNMAGAVTVTINTIPVSYEVTGGGSYCDGSTGVHVGLGGSQTGVNYQLYRDAVAAGTAVAGTGANIGFGLQTAQGTYSVIATSTAACMNNMAGNVPVAINALPAAHAVTGGGNYCPGGVGVHIGLMGSEAGVNYQLYTGASAFGPMVSGTGGDLDFGLQSALGTYSVRATDASTACTGMMANAVSVGLHTLPADFTVMASSSSYCAGGTGVAVSLAGSAPGIEYQLYYNAAADGTAIAGNGSTLSFGPKTAPGIYTVIARDVVTTCVATMPGSPVINIKPLPTSYNITGGGSYCAGGTGVPVGTIGSDIGTNYQLYNGAAPIGGMVAGTGTPLSFGAKTAAGTYSVVAVNAATSCASLMPGVASVVINALPAITSVTGGGSYCAGTGGVHIGLLLTDNTARYQLYNGTAAVGAPVAGTNGTLDFGAQTAAGAYTVSATNIANTCSSNMSGSATITANALPSAFAVTGGGGYCNGSTGVHIGLIGSTLGISYRLYNGATPVGGALPGTGGTLDFGLQTAIGVYSVLATNPATTCTRNMAGSVSVSINPLPDANDITGGGSYCAGTGGVHIGLSSSNTGVNYLLYNGSSLSATVAGSGGVIDFGPQTGTGMYTVNAVNASTGCARAMPGSAAVSTTPVVVPSVTVTSAVGNNICAGVLAVFTATQANGGTAPVYQWTVNGTNVGFATGSYSYFPADGDVVGVALTSSIGCALPSTVSSAITMAVHANATPVVTDSVSPGDTVCGGTMVTFTATPLFGGTAPTYTWVKNGVSVGTGSTYAYLPADGDVVYSKMVSNYGCLASGNATGNSIRITVANPVAPSVAIFADPGTNVAPGQDVKLTAFISNGGDALAYQWFINGVAVPGATNATFTNQYFISGDSVTCQVTNNSPCGNLLSFNSVIITMNSDGVAAVAAGSIDVRIFPNPNNGAFTIKGAVGTGNGDVAVEVTDMLGQIVYHGKAAQHNGAINEHITLNKSLANGMYIVNVQAGAEHKVFHVMVNQ